MPVPAAGNRIRKGGRRLLQGKRPAIDWPGLADTMPLPWRPREYGAPVSTSLSFCSLPRPTSIVSRAWTLSEKIADMAATGKESTFCMGDDIPLAILSERSHVIYDYFKQRFAQVGGTRLGESAPCGYGHGAPLGHRDVRRARCCGLGCSLVTFVWGFLYAFPTRAMLAVCRVRFAFEVGRHDRRAPDTAHVAQPCDLAVRC